MPSKPFVITRQLALIRSQGSDLSHHSVRARASASSPRLDPEEVVEDGADKVVVEEEAAHGVHDQEGQDWQAGDGRIA